MDGGGDTPARERGDRRRRRRRHEHEQERRNGCVESASGGCLVRRVWASELGPGLGGTMRTPESVLSMTDGVNRGAPFPRTSRKPIDSVVHSCLRITTHPKEFTEIHRLCTDAQEQRVHEKHSELESNKSRAWGKDLTRLPTPPHPTRPSECPQAFTYLHATEASVEGDEKLSDPEMNRASFIPSLGFTPALPNAASHSRSNHSIKSPASFLPHECRIIKKSRPPLNPAERETPPSLPAPVHSSQVGGNHWAVETAVHDLRRPSRNRVLSYYGRLRHLLQYCRIRCTLDDPLIQMPGHRVIRCEHREASSPSACSTAAID
ncbi:hypothetical protein Mp_8g16450 [Marchantia polymorpha subsp. ruderalis]|uniref:Uncharacterized protein n=1 Tax=Marchantia polymorpha TaxID=3197 RepID=A0A2R6W4R9_MARPO|nr:hypothetical protein MARPO_0154s0019 [Marchantia polymorpha]BBN20101.1 hypothetical protein Mp_8g16450 [Marchantia polymorpha subsp. ruderalis]|eukprot:PTQ28792.1 hypothetical protein MARPO_0154s0019 [Marchantia polymorpha]